MEASFEITGVFPVFNKAAALPFFLRCLKTQRDVPATQYVFVDDASTDDSLAVLKRETVGWSNVTIIENAANAGPSIRLNQGARAAEGRFLALFDCDEILAPDALAALYRAALETGADAVHGKWRRSDASLAEAVAAPVGDAPEIVVHDRPLERALGRGIIRMTWLVERSLFARAGGCDESVFIQDESLALRLSASAKRLADLRAPVTLVLDAGSHLSANQIQQHHDRFFTYYNFLQSRDLPGDLRGKVETACASAAWKALRDGASLPRLYTTTAYLRAKLGAPAGRQQLARMARLFAAQPGVRRVQAA